jgi:hypothetical protein
MIAAIVTLTVVSAGTVMLVKTIVLRQQQLVQRHWQLQAQLLAASAVERAELRRKADPRYAGETWEVTIPDASTRNGRAQIAIAPSGGTGSVRITVQADVPADPVHHARCTLRREFASSALQMPEQQRHSLTGIDR